MTKPKRKRQSKKTPNGCKTTKTNLTNNGGGKVSAKAVVDVVVYDLIRVISRRGNGNLPYDTSVSKMKRRYDRKRFFYIIWNRFPPFSKFRAKRNRLSIPHQMPFVTKIFS